MSRIKLSQNPPVDFFRLFEHITVYCKALLLTEKCYRSTPNEVLMEHVRWSAKCGPLVQEYYMAVERGNRKTDFWLGFVAWWFVYLRSSHRSQVQSWTYMQIDLVVSFFLSHSACVS